MRRLRAGRSISSVVELGQLKMNGCGFRGVSRATLSDIENGRVLPSVESLFSLAVLYQVPASRLLHCLLEENVVESVDLPAEVQEIRESFTAAVAVRDWPRALALAVHGCKVAATPDEAIRWRLNRSTAMERLGMRDDAISDMQACLASPDLPKGEKFKVHRELARQHGSAGNLTMAEMHLTECLRVMPAVCDAQIRAAVLLEQVRLVTLRRAWGVTETDNIAEARERLATARRLLGEPPPQPDRHLMDHLRAQLHEIDGDSRKARVGYGSVLADARVSGLRYWQVAALTSLAVLLRGEDAAEARGLLAEASDIAVDAGYLDEAFSASFDLLELAESVEQRRHYYRKCQRLYPFLQTTTLAVRRFHQCRVEFSP